MTYQEELYQGLLRTPKKNKGVTMVISKKEHDEILRRIYKGTPPEPKPTLNRDQINSKYFRPYVIPAGKFCTPSEITRKVNLRRAKQRDDRKAKSTSMNAAGNN